MSAANSTVKIQS